MPKNHDNQNMATKSGLMLKVNKILFESMVYIMQIVVQGFSLSLLAMV